ncbi:MAG: STAS domain-containing protein [Clostridia bacterium]|nr:STAS domain-containing protein [Clostridia bacterium]
MQEVVVKNLENGTLNIVLSGDIDLGNADEFYTAVITAYKATPANLCFDCEKLNFIDSTTLGTFVKILKAAKVDGYKMRLEKLQPKIKKLFLICSLDSIMELA